MPGAGIQFQGKRGHRADQREDEMDQGAQPEGPGPLDKSPKRSLEDPTKEEEEEEEEARDRPRTRSQTQARKKKVTFLQAATTSQEFESVCTRRPDGTVDMEPANLARMCTLLRDAANLPYRQSS